MYKDIEAFTCTMYGYARETSVNVVRSKMLKKMVGEDHGLDKNSKVDLSRLPPCQDSLVPHTTRVNYRAACYKRANTPIFEKPKPHDQDQGWVIDDDGIIEPKWTNGPVLPQSLIDLMADHTETEEDEDADIEVEVDEYDIEEENDEL